MSEDTNRADPNPPSVDRLSVLWRRINDYKIAQWTVAYVAVAYGIQHGVILTSESFEWPNAVARISMLLLVLGLPLVVTFAWYHGERASRQFSRAELTIISILLVIGSLFFYVFVQPSAEVAAGSRPSVQQAGVAAARAVSLNPATAISIAVLPFTNLSSDKEQEFFSDGMTEEITSALAKIPDLRVVGRTSAFQFKDKNQDLRAIGQALSATHLLEGSVRKEGNRVRITAQLILAENGVHIWTESYDRELTGVFAIQEDIATAIAGALRMPLGLKPGEQLVSSRTNNLESYQEFLRLRAQLRARGTRTLLTDLEKIVARDPGFAPAWGLLGVVNSGIPNLDFAIWSRSVDQTRQLVQGGMAKADKAAREAIRLDPKLAIGYSVLGAVEAYRNNYAADEDLLRQALALDPNDPDILSARGSSLARIGRLKESVQFSEQARALEPLVPLYNTRLSIALLESGQADTAIAVLEANHPTVPAQIGFRNETLARAYAAKGRYEDAADMILAVPKDRYGNSGQSIEEAARLIRGAPSKTGAPESLPVLPSRLNFIYAYVGALNRMMEYPERALEARLAVPRFMFDPLMAPVRKTERFKAWARKAGLVDYWKASGWPDTCHPTGAEDFVCN